jgi:CheY-like chemotaxis protein
MTRPSRIAAQKGLALASSFGPEVVLLDLGMPGMSGYEVAVALRQLPGLSDVYIAALTGWNDARTKALVTSSGFDKHLVKPAEVGVVLDLVDSPDVGASRRRSA